MGYLEENNYISFVLSLIKISVSANGNSYQVGLFKVTNYQYNLYY